MSAFPSSSSATSPTWKKTAPFHARVPSQSVKAGAMHPIMRPRPGEGQTWMRLLWISAGRLSARMWRRRRCGRWKEATASGDRTRGGAGDARWRSQGGCVISSEIESKARCWREPRGDGEHSRLHKNIHFATAAVIVNLIKRG